MPTLFPVGKKVVYPTHGVARVEAIEEKVVSGEREAFYILRMFGNGMTVLVPTRKAQQVRLREVIRRTEVPKVMAILRRNDLEICSNWNRRYKDHQERIKSGSLYEVALVLRKLILLQKDRCLSFGEKKMLETVRSLLVSEISHAAGIDEGEAGRMIDRTIATA